MLVMYLKGAALSLALSLDAFATSLAYGGNGVRIPLVSAFLINIICVITFGISLSFGMVFGAFVPNALFRCICFGVLFISGVAKLLDNWAKTLIKKGNNCQKHFNFLLFNFRIVLNIYADPMAADADRSKDITPLEACSLALALSLDSLTVGFGAAFLGISPLWVLCSSFLLNGLAILCGTALGGKAVKSNPKLAYLSGVILIILAFSKLL